MHPIRRFKAWLNWAEYSNLSRWRKILVLFGIVECKSFEAGWCSWKRR